MHQWRDPRHRYRDYAKGLIIGLSDWRGAAAMPPHFFARSGTHEVVAGHAGSGRAAAEAREVGTGGLNWYKAPN